MGPNTDPHKVFGRLGLLGGSSHLVSSDQITPFLQGGPLLVINRVITPINGLINWSYNPTHRSCNPIYKWKGAHLVGF